MNAPHFNDEVQIDPCTLLVLDEAIQDPLVHFEDRYQEVDGTAKCGVQGYKHESNDSFHD